MLRKFTPQVQALTIQQLLQLVKDPKVSDRIVAMAHRYFSLDCNIQSYDSIYRSLVKTTVNNFDY